MSPKVAIGFDHGNGYVKGKSDLVERYIIPSAIAYRSNVSSSIGESLKAAGRKLSEGTSNLDTDTTYVWGEDVYSVKGYIATNGHQDRIKSIPYKVLSEVALGELAGDQELIEAVIVTGVSTTPIDLGTMISASVPSAFISTLSLSHSHEIFSPSKLLSGWFMS